MGGHIRLDLFYFYAQVRLGFSPLFSNVPDECLHFQYLDSSIMSSSDLLQLFCSPAIIIFRKCHWTTLSVK